ncbi:ABC-2 type transport system permease protein [Anaerobranca californiensis DSM 14826]|jgi:ABC-2 type transport system permease protein|uniref:ABC-2 type transport system permease protein n=1 Tax=Anaerobranca californiensis DSM 14826 TaxID=1120989 RepID=A0A1M6MQF9_9FIRM|nr:ABC transporter permease subunit [Anaerobranca californiensis]SHJ85682.1 ABC-2 type transport system permease protein [Anaerobranca californiensis DSM 14826]
MILPLFKGNLKGNWVVGLIILLVMFMYFTVLTSMFDPESLDGLTAMLEMMPKEVIRAMGFDNFGNTFTTYIANSYYNFIAILFPMIYIIVVGNRLIAKHIDSGSMAYLLSTPNSRLNIIKTQACYFLTSITFIFFILTVYGIIISEVFFQGHLEILPFILLNLVTMFTFYAISGIVFFFSSIASDTKQSLSFGAGIPIAFFVINMLAKVGFYEK